MSQRGPFPTENDAFNTYFNQVFTYLTNPANLARLLISAVNMADLNTQQAAWVVLFPLSQNAATATKQNRGERDDLRDDIETTLRAIYDDIPASVLTATDRSTLNLPLPDTTRTPRGPIEDIPIADVKAIGGGSVKCRVRVTEDASRASRHELADGIEMKYMLIDPTATAVSTTPPGGTTPGTPTPGTPATTKQVAPTSADDCSLTHFSPKAVFKMAFGASAAGKVLYCFFRWANHTTPANSSDWTGISVVHLS